MAERQSDVAETLRSHRGLILVAFDIGALLIAYCVFSILRYGDNQPELPWRGVAVLAIIAIVTQVSLGLLLRIYHGRASVGSIDETVYLGMIALVGAVIATIFNILSSDLLAARTIPFGAAFTGLGIMLFGRAQWRRYAKTIEFVDREHGKDTVVVGAGNAASQLVHSMKTSTASPYEPVALVDDDHWKRHLRLDGVPVKGTLDDLERVVEETGAEAVVIAIPSASRELVRDLAERARTIGVDVKVLPPVEEMFGDQVTIRDVRDINVADLLGRGAIETDIASIVGFLKGKRVLVTGAGGSIGSELSRQISKWNPAELMMLDRDESALHGVQLSIHGKALLDSPDVILCDIRDTEALFRVFDERKPEVVFHAAALKHLPMLEQYPAEAIKTNVVGTRNVLEAAHRVGVQRFVNVSTDKAADPTSVLGYSKRAAERITADYARLDDGTYLSVRFGNVLGSRGSVLTTFAAQIAAGGPVTVTHPDVTRYFMTVNEAVQLVLQAGAIGRDGEVLILDMGQPVRIDDVARQLIRLAGRNIEIQYTGLREGEKLDEVLLSDAESDNRPVHPLISHVRVSPLPAEAVMGHDKAVAEGAVERMCRWCGLDPAVERKSGVTSAPVGRGVREPVLAGRMSNGNGTAPHGNGAALPARPGARAAEPVTGTN